MKLKHPKSAVVLAIIILLSVTSVLVLKNTEVALGAEKIINAFENEILEMVEYIRTMVRQVQEKMEQIKTDFSEQIQDVTGIGGLRQQQEEYQQRQRPGGGPPGKGSGRGGF